MVCMILNHYQHYSAVSSSSSTEDDPTFCTNKVWKQVEGTDGAVEALQMHHDDLNQWEVSKAYGGTK